MKCAICKNGKTEPGDSTVVLERNHMTLVFKQVPSEICDNCGEEYISSHTNKELLTTAETEYERGVSIDI
jgi:YgiT-type zinc finger domain-containing protein